MINNNKKYEKLKKIKNAFSWIEPSTLKQKIISQTFHYLCKPQYFKTFSIYLLGQIYIFY